MFLQSMFLKTIIIIRPTYGQQLTVLSDLFPAPPVEGITRDSARALPLVHRARSAGRRSAAAGAALAADALAHRHERLRLLR